MEYLSLAGDLTYEHAVERLLSASTATDPNSELCIDARHVQRTDAVTAAATRLRSERHLSEHPQGTITLIPPHQVDVAARLTDLLDPPPSRMSISTGAGKAPATYTLLPATTILDSEAAVAAGGWIFEACGRARISLRRASFISAATIELADNALLHARQPAIAPVIAVTSTGRDRIVQIAVLDTGNGISEAADPVEALRVIPSLALRGGGGFLAHIMSRARGAGVDVQVQILAGTGRLLWSTSRHRTERRRYLPGTSVIVRVGGDV